MLKCFPYLIFSWAVESPADNIVQISSDRDIVVQQMSLATITYTGTKFDHGNTDFPGMLLLDVICGKQYTYSYLASLIFTELYNKIESLDRRKYGREYNLLNLKVDVSQFKIRYFEIASAMKLKHVNNVLINDLVQSKRLYITPTIAVMLYMVLFLANPDVFGK
jgi:hypothetical protein